MKRTVLALSALISANAMADNLPVVGICEPNAPSGYRPGTITVNGHNKAVELHVFGSDQVKRAQDYGRNLAPMYYSQKDFMRVVYDKGVELYHGDQYFIRCFEVKALEGYSAAMQIEPNRVSQ
jgi:hypothetical protein